MGFFILQRSDNKTIIMENIQVSCMNSITCPRCSNRSQGIPYRYQISGYARCPYCNSGIVYTSEFLKTSMEEESSYIPEGCSVSPKSNRIISGNRIHKSGRFISYFFKRLFNHPNPKSQAKRKGTLKGSLQKL